MAKSDKSERRSSSTNEDKQHETPRKGGQSASDEKRGSSQDRNQTSETVKKGGEASQGGRGKGGRDDR